MKKSVLQNLSDTKLADGSDIFADEHREVNDGIIAAVYQTPVYDNLVNQTYITTLVGFSGGQTLDISIWFKRIGNEVVLSGDIKSNVNQSIPPTRIASFKDSEFVPDDRLDPRTSLPYVFRFIATAPNGETITMLIRVVSGVAYLENRSFINISTQTFYFNGARYDAKD